jgi:hypothetical protein
MMQEELGSPDTEEVTMDEDLGALDAVADAEEAVDTPGGLSVYNNNPNVQTAVTARSKLDSEYKKYYEDLAEKIMAQRSGPSFSERMFQLSAALAKPTRRRGFGGILANVAPVLQAQEQAKREGEISRQEALRALQAAQLNQRMGLANQDVTTALAMAKLEAMANKTPTMKSVLIEGGKAYDPVSGENIVQPNDVAWADLASDPSQANYDDFVRQFGPRFAEKAMRIVNYARRGK